MQLTVFFDATKDIVDVIWEEPLGVEHRLDEACDRPEWHRLVVSVSVPLESLSNPLDEHVPVGGETVHGQNSFVGPA